MHPINEYHDLLQNIIVQAKKMVDCLSSSRVIDGYEVINFLHDYGCEGHPSDQVATFKIGPKFDQSGTPLRQSDAITIVPCFSDDIPPAELPDQSKSVNPASFMYSDQVIVLYNVDHWSLPELALSLLHEGRHARHRLGLKLANLSPLDKEDFHETNTWLFILDVLVAWGGSSWQKAVQKEVWWLKKQRLKSTKGKIVYADSGQYRPELDDLFGTTKHQEVQFTRQQLLSLFANMQHWSHGRNSTLSEMEICHALIKLSYG